MKIGIDIRTLTDEFYSGVSEYTQNLVKHFLELDKRNEYILFYNAFGDVSQNIRLLEEFKKNARIVRTSYPNKYFNYILQKTLQYPRLDRICGNVDIFFAPHINFSSFSGESKKFLTIHDLSYLRYPEFFSRRKNIWHRLVNIKKIVSDYDCIIAVSESTKYDIVELLRVDVNKVRVVRSGVGEEYKVLDENKNKDKFEAVRRYYGLPEKFFLVLNNLEPRKNIAGIIRAYDFFREKNATKSNYKLVLAGASGWMDGEAGKEYENSKYKNDIIFIGYVRSEDRVYLLNMAFLLIYYSFYEGFGFPPLEAFASGCPVISGNASSLPEVLADAAIMVDPYNEKQLASALERVVVEDGLNARLSGIGIDRAKVFDWRKTAQKYLEIFTGQ